MRSWLGTSCDSMSAGCPHRTHTFLVMRGRGVVCRVCGVSSAKGRCGLQKPCKPPEGRARQKVFNSLRAAAAPPAMELELVSEASEGEQLAAPEMAAASETALSHTVQLQPADNDSLDAHDDSLFSHAPRVPRDCGFDDPDRGYVSESDM